MSKEKKSQQSKIEAKWKESQDSGWTTPLSEPPESFRNWWRNHDHCPMWMQSNRGVWGYSSGIGAEKAWQMQCYQDEFKERRNENAKGTGVYYAYFGWHRNEPKPTSSIDQFAAHREWCKEHGRPDPLEAEKERVPEEFLGVKNFTDMKRVIAAQLRKKGAKEKEIKKVVDDVVDSLAEKMDMNKAIGWTQEDSDRANLGLYEP
jgi:hypothetical protein